MIGNIGMANSAEEDGMEGLQLLEAVFRHHFPRLRIRFAAPVKRAPMQAKVETPARRFQHTDTFRNHFFSDAVSSDHRNVEGFHQLRFIVLPRTAAARARTYRERPPTPL